MSWASQSFSPTYKNFMIAVTGSERATAMLRQRGHDAVYFPDGQALERAVRAGTVVAVLDLAPVEMLVDADRLMAAAILGLPQVVSLGGFDAELSAEVLDAVGQRLAQIVCAARGPTRVLVPGAAATAAMQALGQSLRNWIAPSSLLVESTAAWGAEKFWKQACDLIEGLAARSAIKECLGRQP